MCNEGLVLCDTILFFFTGYRVKYPEHKKKKKETELIESLCFIKLDLWVVVFRIWQPFLVVFLDEFGPSSVCGPNNVAF